MCPGKPVNYGLQGSKGDTEGAKGEMAEGKREPVGESYEHGGSRGRKRWRAGKLH